MTKILTTLFLLICLTAGATTFTEFYCDAAGGTNVNSGTTTNAAALYTCFSGHWTNSTATFVPTDGGDSSTNVSIGDWVSIVVDGSTNLLQTGAGGWVALVTNVTSGVNGKIMLSRAAFMGTSPADQVATATLRKGGCWQGPYRTIGFPWGFAANTGTNGPGVTPRINFRNTSQYNVTATMTHSLAGPTKFQGMTTTPGDLGRATFDGGNPGSSFTMLNIAGGTYLCLEDLVIANNGSSTPAAVGINSASGNYNTASRCVVHHIAGQGFSVLDEAIECEAFACNQFNSTGLSGFHNCLRMINCQSHDHTPTQGNGFSSTTAQAIWMDGCLAWNCARDGLYMNGNYATVKNSEFYNCKSNGVEALLSGQSVLIIQNCNFAKNGFFGITNVSTATLRSGRIYNCGFGSGTAANGSGDIATNGLCGIDIGPQTIYAANVLPWTDPANGNFTINSSSPAKAMGRAFFLQSTINSPTNTVGYPDIGAAQSPSTNAASGTGGGSYTFAQ